MVVASFQLRIQHEHWFQRERDTISYRVCIHYINRIYIHSIFPLADNSFLGNQLILACNRSIPYLPYL